MICVNCRRNVPNTPFCAACGAPQQAPMRGPYQQPLIRCQRCGGTNIAVQVMQENYGGAMQTVTKSKTYEKRHGILWWLFVGWWWWIIDIFLWLFAFPFRAIVALTRKKKYVTKGVTYTSQQNRIAYRKICACQQCGNSWTQPM